MIKCVLLNAHCTLIAEVVEVDAEITIKTLNVSHKLNGTLTAPD